MQNIAPFCAWRYKSNRVGDLDQLIAPPYDVIDEALQSCLYARSPYNIVRVDLGKTTSSDNDCDNRYTRAASQLQEWKNSQILLRDAKPSVTFVEEEFTGPDRQTRTRRGFLALLKLHEFADKVVFPHEWTLSGAKEDRFRLLQATQMSLSPVFILYDLPGDEITKAWQSHSKESVPAQIVRDLEAGDNAPVTRLWQVTDSAMLELIEKSLTHSRYLIADGHHRYETALRYRKYREDNKTNTPACEYALAYFTNTADPALTIFATHRLVKNVDAAVVAALPQILSENFTVVKLTNGSGQNEAAADEVAAREAIAKFLEAHPRGAFAMWGPILDCVYGFYVDNWELMHKSEGEESLAYKQLDVTILQNFVLKKALGITVEDMAAGTHVDFFKEPDAAFERLACADYQVGFFMNPTGLEQVQEVAFGGERMPQKATFFYPKLPTGLVFHDLSGDIS